MRKYRLLPQDDAPKPEPAFPSRYAYLKWRGRFTEEMREAVEKIKPIEGVRV